MFGESESESPRVPSPWDNLISSRSPSRSPPSYPASLLHSSPHLKPLPSLHITLPRLVPEADSGNVEYKLQLLSPSPARFARLVTQLKWRLLEGGGQAYYELGVADSGALVGLPRTEMESSLETLEMMAGEIGASVIVVKEIEVPEAMVTAVKAQQEAGVDLNWVGEEKWGRTRKRRGMNLEEDGTTTTTTTDATATETTDVEGEEEGENLSATAMLCRPALHASSHSSSSGSIPIFAMDPEPDIDPAEHADGEQEPDNLGETTEGGIVIDLEIASVFKPRPVRNRMHSAHLMNLAGRSKRQKKMFKPPFKEKKTGDGGDAGGKTRHRRQGRDKKRTVDAVDRTTESSSVSVPDFLSPLPPPVLAEATTQIADKIQADNLARDMEALHVSVEMHEDAVPTHGPVAIPDCAAEGITVTVTEVAHGLDQESFVVADKCVTEKREEHVEANGDDDDDDDVFSAIVSARDTAMQSDIGKPDEPEDAKRIIVEALVVRKMSLEEAFLDFGAFAN